MHSVRYVFMCVCLSLCISLCIAFVSLFCRSSCSSFIMYFVRSLCCLSVRSSLVIQLFNGSLISLVIYLVRQVFVSFELRHFFSQVFRSFCLSLSRALFLYSCMVSFVRHLFICVGCSLFMYVGMQFISLVRDFCSSFVMYVFLYVVRYLFSSLFRSFVSLSIVMYWFTSLFMFVARVSSFLVYCNVCMALFRYVFLYFVRYVCLSLQIARVSFVQYFVILSLFRYGVLSVFVYVGLSISVSLL